MINYQPKDGSVLYCDYAGFRKPEMIKKRPVIVIRKHRQNSRLLMVVPISSTEPIPLRAYHVQMEEEFCQLHLKGKPSWVKCDMMNVMGLERFCQIKNANGERYIPQVTVEFLQKVKDAVKHAHGL